MRVSEIAKLCEMAYRCPGCTEEQHCRAVEREVLKQGLLVRCFGSESTEGYVAYHPSKKYAYVIFRGTERELSDICHDLCVWPHENLSGPGHVHAGTQSALSSVWGQVVQILKETEVVCSVFAGHSLGGMLATLAACWCYSELPSVVVGNLYTFGSPPIGDREFAGSLGFTLRGKICNYVNFVDVVPRLITPRLMGYRVAGHVHYMTPRSGVIPNPALIRRVADVLLESVKAIWRSLRYCQFRAPGIACHSISQYRELLEKAGE